ncbi:trimeric intracellular cation channel family protein [Pontibacter beigongshangensis]|uniref:trimeric intracellular cation channel family protein n=1 Tax=Pontibacter beigongshangensis TaxID=2574733 RepID=UPI00164F3419|nr:trimeric intracellular cation channel family protein [Pontibacter beigongshangensis]
MSIQLIFEFLGTFVFAMSGALAVGEKGQEHDWFGASFIGFVTAIGGGSLRDVLLGSYPLVWVQDVRLLYIILAGIVSAGLFYPVVVKLKRTFQLFDTLGIALFTIVGTEKAISLGFSAEVAVIMGMFSAVMGGVLRDMLTNEIPVLFRKEIYASACMMGAIIYLVLMDLGVERNTTFLAAVIFIIITRLVAIKYNLSLPKFGRQV